MLPKLRISHHLLQYDTSRGKTGTKTDEGSSGLCHIRPPKHLIPSVPNGSFGSEHDNNPFPGLTKIIKILERNPSILKVF